MFTYQNIRLVTICAATALLLTLAACGPKIDNGGYVQREPIKDQVTVGKSTRDDVKAKLGSPSSQSSFGEETWYYISDRKEAYAFLRPEIVQQDVVGIVFDDKGVVSRMDNYNIDNSEDFEIVKRTTPTEGHTLGFFEQVLGNVGRFNSPNSGAPGSITPGRQPGT